MKQLVLFMSLLTIYACYVLSLTGCIGDNETIIEDTSNPYADYNKPTGYDTVTTTSIIGDTVFYVDEVRAIIFDTLTREFNAEIIDSVNIRYARGYKSTPTFDTTYNDTTYYYVEPFELIVNESNPTQIDTSFNALPFEASTLDTLIVMTKDTTTNETMYIRVVFELVFKPELDSFVIDTFPYDTIPYDEYIPENQDTVEIEVEQTVAVTSSLTNLSFINTYGSSIQLELWRGSRLHDNDKTTSYDISYDPLTTEISGYDLTKFYSGELSNNSEDNNYIIQTSMKHALLIIIGFKTYSGLIEYLDHAVITNPDGNKFFIDASARIQEIL